MTMIFEPAGATVIQFPHTMPALPRHTMSALPRLALVEDEQAAGEAVLPDNVVSLARFTRTGRRTRRVHWLGTPPDGEAA